jgi:precorrin-3B synthase
MAGVTTDRCPGVLRPHQAADGAMVRIRVPGGQTTGRQLRRLGELAGQYGSGLLQLTSRASLQVRGLPDPLPDAFEQAVTDAGLLPSAAHERVRNLLCSPLTGLDGGRADLRPLVAELDRAIRADTVLATLSGRFLFGLDDGRGDIAALEPDLTYCAVDAEQGLVLVGPDLGFPVPRRDAVTTLVALAHDFALARAASGAWRVHELPTWVRGLPDLQPVPRPERPVMPLGRVGDHASVQVPLGFLTPAQLAAVAALAGEGPVVLTPWRGLVVAGGAAALDTLAATGLVADAASPWTAISACVGGPWCANGRVDTQSLVRSVAGLDAAWPRTHVSGCERRCGAPTVAHHDLVAPSRDDLLAVALPRPALSRVARTHA